MVDQISLPAGLRKLIHRFESLPGSLRRVYATPDPVDLCHAVKGADWHFHENPTCLVCLDGGLTCVFRERMLQLEAGDAVVIAAATWHRVHHERGSASIEIGYGSRHVDFWFAGYGQGLLGLTRLQPIARLLNAAAQAPSAGLRRSTVVELLRHLVEADHDHFATAHPAVMAMIEALWQPLDGDLSVATILAASGLGRAQAYALFKRHYGRGPAQAIEDRRLLLAEALIGKEPVATIAARCGYDSRASFTRAWKRRHGTAPSHH